MVEREHPMAEARESGLSTEIPQVIFEAPIDKTEEEVAAEKIHEVAASMKEGAKPPVARSKPRTSKKAASKRPSAKRSGAKKTTARKPAAKKSTAKRAGAK